MDAKYYYLQKNLSRFRIFFLVEKHIMEIWLEGATPNRASPPIIPLKRPLVIEGWIEIEHNNWSGNVSFTRLSFLSYPPETYLHGYSRNHSFRMWICTELLFWCMVSTLTSQLQLTCVGLRLGLTMRWGQYKAPFWDDSVVLCNTDIFPISFFC